jgi:hypothetical protein
MCWRLENVSLKCKMLEKGNDESHSQSDGVTHQMRTQGDQYLVSTFMEGMYIFLIGGQFDDDV